ncbi:MAG: spiro-SPASM protein [Leptospira sp.]|nr:spiro-SPASM protein [Leptospira sp.]
MDRKDYKPSCAAVYLNSNDLKYLSENFNRNLWLEFFNRIEKLIPNLPVYININSHLISHCEDLSLKNVKWINNELSELEFLQIVGESLPKSKFNDPDWDEVCFWYFTGISPILNIRLTEKSWNRHKQFFSQYSYSENLPSGLIPTTISREFLSSLPQKLNTDVHSFFLKNINLYDVDIFFQAPDLRQMRLDFRVNSERSEILVNGILQKNPEIEYEEISEFLKQNPDLLRPSPSYIEWEVYHGCELKCTFCPREFSDLKNDGKFIHVTHFKETLAKMNAHWKSPTTICFGGNGEPLLHPEFVSLVENSLQFNKIKEIIIETALYTNFEAFQQYLLSLSEDEKSRISIIVNLTTLNESTYKNLYGTNHLETIKDRILKLKETLPLKSLNVQMIKMVDVESEIDPYFTYFEKQGINVILQKYNSFAGKLPEKRVSDLTPIHRDFCWHLTRDLYIKVDGSVSICKQEQNYILGNIYSEDILKIWQNGLIHFQNSFIGKHELIPAPCLNCDEWYTFNA